MTAPTVRPLATVVAVGVLPVLVLDDPDHSAPLADALVAGGLPCAEVTLRTSAAIEVIRRMAADPRMLVGAGTVTTVQQAESAVAAGARFVVSPGLDPAIVKRCHALGVDALPGVATASEVMAAVAAGARTVKLFPAGPLGGPPMVQALAAPFAGVRFVPTGGVGAGDVAAYLRLPAVAAVGGSWIATAGALRAGDFAAITQRAAAAVDDARRARAADDWAGPA